MLAGEMDNLLHLQLSTLGGGEKLLQFCIIQSTP